MDEPRGRTQSLAKIVVLSSPSSLHGTGYTVFRRGLTTVYSLHHRILLSNFFAQPEALAFGKTEEQVREELGPDASEPLLKSKVFEGNRPGNSIIFPKLTPATLGALIALYEHKIFTQGVIWSINPSLGKVLAKNILAQLDKPEDVSGHDSSTTGLIHYYQKHRKE
ncbi:hypothetical protein C8Q72DRAFT_891027 [Fomitopsis betulina]|nr:hypothetical protein C8Q72DRAFT_891027 [Fomitopsis betulina]